MTILIILVALIAIAFIFGRGPAQAIVLGSGALGVIVIVVILAVALFGGFQEWLEIDEIPQRIITYLLLAYLFSVIFGMHPFTPFTSIWGSLTKEKRDKQNVDGDIEYPKQKQLTHAQIVVAVIIVSVFLA